MTPYPVYAYSGPPEWWEILAALGPWILLLVAGFVWWLALRQETKDVTRNDQWARALWGLEASMDENPNKRRVGIAVLDLLHKEAAADSDVARIVAQARQGGSGREGGPSVMNGKPN